MQILQACIWKRQRNVQPKDQEFYVPVVYTDYVLDIQKLDKNWERFSFSSYEILLQSFIASFHADQIKDQLSEWEKEIRKETLKELILEFESNQLEGKGYDFYFAIRTKLDDLF